MGDNQCYFSKVGLQLHQSDTQSGRKPVSDGKVGYILAVMGELVTLPTHGLGINMQDRLPLLDLICYRELRLHATTSRKPQHIGRCK